MNWLDTGRYDTNGCRIICLYILRMIIPDQTSDPSTLVPGSNRASIICFTGNRQLFIRNNIVDRESSFLTPGNKLIMSRNIRLYIHYDFFLIYYKSHVVIQTHLFSCTHREHSNRNDRSAVGCLICWGFLMTHWTGWSNKLTVMHCWQSSMATEPI